MKLTTSKGRTVAVGPADTAAKVMTAAAQEGKGQLLAIKGSAKTVPGERGACTAASTEAGSAAATFSGLAGTVLVSGMLAACAGTSAASA